MRGDPQPVTFPAAATTIQENTFTIIGEIAGPDETSESGDTRIGVDYDIVLDRDRDGIFDTPRAQDAWGEVTAESRTLELHGTQWTVRDTPTSPPRRAGAGRSFHENSEWC